MYKKSGYIVGWPRIISNPTSAHCIGSSFYFHFLGHWKPQCNAIVCALMYVCTAMLWGNECMIVYPDLPTHHSMFCVLCMATVYTACYWGVGMCCLSSLVLYPERDMLLFVNTQYIHLGLWMDRIFIWNVFRLNFASLPTQYIHCIKSVVHFDCMYCMPGEEET